MNSTGPSRQMEIKVRFGEVENVPAAPISTSVAPSLKWSRMYAAPSSKTTMVTGWGTVNAP